MPHWINLSFYSTNKKVAYSNFIPRIKLPPSLIDNNSERCIQSVKTNLVAEEDYLHNSFFDYDAYDAQVFQIPAVPQVHEVGYVRSEHFVKITYFNFIYFVIVFIKRRPAINVVLVDY